MTASVTIQLHRDIAANWTSINPVLAVGEPGVETDTGKFKIGDGTHTWTALAYAGGGSVVVPLGSTSGAIACDLSKGVCFTVTLTGDGTFTFTNPPPAPLLIEPLLIVTQDAVGGHKVTIPGLLNAPVVNASAGTVTTIPITSPDQLAHLIGPGVSEPNRIAPFSRPGILAVETSNAPLLFPVTGTIISVTAVVNTAPTGAAVIVDILKNGTTIFTTTANRPTIAAGGIVSSPAVPDVTAINAGDIFRAQIVQVGSTVAGSDLNVVMLVQ